jgi:hypothetical protein
VTVRGSVDVVGCGTAADTSVGGTTAGERATVSTGAVAGGTDGSSGGSRDAGCGIGVHEWHIGLESGCRARMREM